MSCVLRVYVFVLVCVCVLSSLVYLVLVCLLLVCVFPPHFFLSASFGLLSMVNCVCKKKCTHVCISPAKHETSSCSSLLAFVCMFACLSVCFSLLLRVASLFDCGLLACVLVSPFF